MHLTHWVGWLVGWLTSGTPSCLRRGTLWQGLRSQEAGRRGRLCLTLHSQCHHRNDFCTALGSDESLLTISRDMSEYSVLRPQLWKRGQPKRNRTAHQPNALPLGQTGSRFVSLFSFKSFGGPDVCVCVCVCVSVSVLSTRWTSGIARAKGSYAN